MKHLAKQFTLILSRAGQPAQVTRKARGATNSLGKSSATWEPVGETVVVPDFGRGGKAKQSAVSGGEFDITSPKLSFPLDSDVQDGDRVTFGGQTYELATTVRLQTHITAKAVSVNES